MKGNVLVILVVFALSLMAFSAFELYQRNQLDREMGAQGLCRDTWNRFERCK